MPELPEVEITVRGLKKKVLNRAFIDIWSDAQKIVKKPGFEDFKKEIKNRRIKNIWRRGKNIIFDLSGDLHLLVHLKMTGHFLYNKTDSFTHLKFFLDNGKILAFSDLRKFAKILLLSDNLLKKELELLGPEPLDEKFTFSKFKVALQKSKGRIKQILMDQEIIVGIGNIYSDEILWEAKINPFKNISELSEKELKNIYNPIKKILNKAISVGGTSISDFRDINNERGGYGDLRKVYRKEGEKCSRCETKIERKKIGSRSTCFCPVCQKL